MDKILESVRKDVEGAERIHKAVFNRRNSVNIIEVIKLWKQSVYFKQVQKIANNQGFDLNICLESKEQ